MRQSAGIPGVPGDSSSSLGWSQPSPTPPSFAGLLAALTAPVPKTAWNNDDLADDVATLSYEHALRAHARYKSTDPLDWTSTQPADSGVSQKPEAPTAAQSEAHTWSEDAAPASANSSLTMTDSNLKRASITIRLSKAECDQLHKRAAAAGLTVSAYLRSCTFEAEALRAQVKDALAELRKSAVPEKQREQTASIHSVARRSSVLRSLFEWFLRFMPHGQDQRAARA